MDGVITTVLQPATHDEPVGDDTRRLTSNKLSSGSSCVGILPECRTHDAAFLIASICENPRLPAGRQFDTMVERS